MDIVYTQQFGPSFEKAILGIKNEPELTYAVTVDALFTSCETNCSFINELLTNREQELSVDKLYGVLIAIKEYQATHQIPDSLIKRIFKLIESRILIDQVDDHKWISEAFTIMKKEYSFKRLKAFIDLALAPYDIPSTYCKPYLDLLKVYVNNAKDNNELSIEFIQETSNMLQQKYDVNNTGKEQYRKFLDEICNIIRSATAGFISEMTEAYNSLSNIKSSLDRQADWGIRGLLIFCIIFYLSLFLWLIEQFNWSTLAPKHVFYTAIIAAIPWLYFLITEKTLKPRHIYDNLKEKNRKRLYQSYKFDPAIVCKFKKS